MIASIYPVPEKTQIEGKKEESGFDEGEKHGKI